MSEQDQEIERRVAAAFAAHDPHDVDERRVSRVLQRIHTEVASRDVLIFVIVRMWATALEFGAGIFACRRRRPGS